MFHSHLQAPGIRDEHCNAFITWCFYSVMLDRQECSLGTMTCSYILCRVAVLICTGVFLKNLRKGKLCTFEPNLQVWYLWQGPNHLFLIFSTSDLATDCFVILVSTGSASVGLQTWHAHSAHWRHSWMIHCDGVSKRYLPNCCPFIQHAFIIFPSLKASRLLTLHNTIALSVLSWAQFTLCCAILPNWCTRLIPYRLIPNY